MVPEHKNVTNCSTFAGRPIIRLEQVINLFHLLQCSSFLGAAIIIELEQFSFLYCIIARRGDQGCGVLGEHTTR